MAASGGNGHDGAGVGTTPADQPHPPPHPQAEAQEQPQEQPQPPARDRRARRVLERAVDVALAAAPVPLRVLDVATGDGALLRALALRLPTAEEFVGADACADAVTAARGRSDPRLVFHVAAETALPLPDEYADLVVCARSADAWPDRGAVLAELRRVLHPAGRVVLVDVRAPRAAVVADAEAAGLALHRRETVTRLAGLPRSRAYVFSRAEVRPAG